MVVWEQGHHYKQTPTAQVPRSHNPSLTSKGKGGKRESERSRERISSKMVGKEIGLT
jgi:hypothetical protein